MAVLVVPVRAAASNEWLRYALRSWCINLPHAAVWLVGHRPHWVDGVGHIPTNQVGLSPWEATSVAMRAACEHPEIPDEFVWVDDDMFAVRPVEQVPVLHRGRLRNVADGRARSAARTVDQYGPQLSGALERLEQLGYADPLCHELHVPLVVRREPMLEALEVAAGVDAAKRSIYAAVAGLEGEQVPDVKVSWRAPRGYGPQSVFVSTAPDAFTNGHVGRWIRQMFPGRCQYEKRGH